MPLTVYNCARKGTTGGPTVRGPEMMHLDYATKSLENNGFTRTEDREDYAVYELEVARGTITVHVGLSCDGSANAIVCKPNGKAKRLFGKTDGQFNAAINQIIKANS